MSYRCEHCASLFFKTLETRYSQENQSVLYKKRCKRCKFKCLVRKDIASGASQAATREEWRLAQKVSLPISGKTYERGRVFISEYALQVSRSAEAGGRYLNRLDTATAQGLRHDAPQANG